LLPPIWSDAHHVVKRKTIRLDFLIELGCSLHCHIRDTHREVEFQVARKEFTVRNKLGLHARAAAKIVQTSSQFQSRMRIIKNGREADAKSMLDILTLSCPRGTRIELRADGKDAAEALAALALLFDNQFGEE
jgi:phosphocarrier protein HPr